jgi:hypothetical protein
LLVSGAARGPRSGLTVTSGHFMAEEAPVETAKAIRALLAR